jgi:hypothetical protein
MGGKNYERFARTNYFDRNGVFVTTMFSMPMLLHMFLAVVSQKGVDCSIIVSSSQFVLVEAGPSHGGIGADDGQGEATAASRASPS